MRNFGPSEFSSQTSTAEAISVTETYKKYNIPSLYYSILFYTLVLYMDTLGMSMTLGIPNRSYLQSLFLQCLVLRQVSQFDFLCSYNTRDRWYHLTRAASRTRALAATPDISFSETLFHHSVSDQFLHRNTWVLSTPTPRFQVFYIP